MRWNTSPRQRITGHMQKSLDKQKEVISTLKKGELVVMPSDTIYGIFASALQPDAVTKLYAVRKRERTKPCIVVLARARDIEKFGVFVTDEQMRYIQKVWRSNKPTSIVLPLSASAKKRFRYLHRGKGSLAFRIPSERSARGRTLKKIVQKTGPLIAPSANLPGRPPAETLSEAKNYFGHNVSVYLGVGRRLVAQASRIIAMKKDQLIEVRS